MTERSADTYDNILVILGNLEQRIYLLEVAVGLVEKTCKVCDQTISIKNANKDALLAELCDECWEKQNCDNSNAID